MTPTRELTEHPEVSSPDVNRPKDTAHRKADTRGDSQCFAEGPLRVADLGPDCESKPTFLLGPRMSNIKILAGTSQMAEKQPNA